MMGFLLFNGHFSAIQIWNQREIATSSETISDPTNLGVKPPPLLYDNYRRRSMRIGWTSQISTDLMTIGTVKLYGFSYCWMYFC
jgi:hypothetical protein